MSGLVSPGLQKWLLSAVLFILLAVAALAGMFERLDLFLYDTCFRIRGAQEPGAEVVIVAMDEQSVQELGSLPWKRSIHANLLAKLGLARTVGFDLTLDSATSSSEDDSLARAIAENGNVVLASQFLFEKGPDGVVEQILNLPKPEFLQGSAGFGFANVPTDSDGVVRQVSMVDVNTFERPLPGFGLAVALNAVGESMDSLSLAGGKLKAGRKTIALDGLNRAMPFFWGPKKTFQTFSYIEALQQSPELFKDKIVLIGDTTAASHDYFQTPYTTSNLVIKGNLPTPGVEVHASVIQSFLSGRWYREVSPQINLLFLLVVGIFTTLLAARKSPWTGIVGTIGVLVLVLAVVYGLWFYRLLWLNPTAPVFYIVLNYSVLTSVNFIRAELGRRHTRSVLRRYVSPAVAEQLMQSPEDVSLGGKRRVITVMFCDIRDFTRYSENKDPEQVVNRLNQYLTVMTKIIFKNGGTLDKYLGDGLMAIFGAPVYYPDHIQRAIETAVEIVREVNLLNGEGDDFPLRIGIGINSGNVLVGNVGSPERMDYTVIGEDVNLASRLEGLTKVFKTPIIISDRSVRTAGGAGLSEYGLQFLGNASVKGFTDSIGVYTPGDFVPEEIC